MLPRLGARAGLVVAALFLATALAPLALADHAYSHRYLVFGRVVDANGDPVPDLTLQLTYKNFEPESPCSDQPGTATEAFGTSVNRPPWTNFPGSPTAFTNADGLFIFCAHTHAMSRTLPGSATITVLGKDVTKEFGFDALTRHSFVTIELPTVEPNATKESRDTKFLVYGRLWEPQSGEPFVENVRVFGDTLDHKLVNITVTLPDGTKLVRNATTNSYGDFAVFVATTSRVTSGTVTIEAENQTFTQDVDGKLGIASFRAEFPKKSDPFVRNALIVVGVLAGAVVLVGGGLFGWRRIQQRREEEMIRERTQRKRANK